MTLLNRRFALQFTLFGALGLSVSLAASQGMASEGKTLRWPVKWDYGASTAIYPGYNPAAYPMSASLVLYNGLTRPDPENGYAPVPDLAEGWKISDDGLVYTFTLRDDIFFHNGAKVTADDVVFTINTARDPMQFMSVLNDLRPVSAVEAVDARTVKITLSEPSAPFLLNIGFAIMPRAVVEPQLTDEVKLPQTEFAKKPIGTGPYMIEEIKPGREMILKGFDKYHRGAPKIDRLVFLLKQSVDNNSVKLLAGEADGGEIDPAFRDVIDGRGFTAITYPSAALQGVRFNVLTPPFDDPKVRAAFNHMTDKAALNDLINAGRGALAAGPFPNTEWDSTAPGTLGYDMAKAESLLKEAGYAKNGDGIWARDGKAISFDIQDAYGFVNLAEAMASQWRDAGIDVNVQSTDWGKLWSELTTTPATTVQFGNPADPDGAYLVLHSEAVPMKGGYNFGSYSNPAVDAALKEGRVAQDKAARKMAYDALQEAYVADPPMAFGIMAAPTIAYVDGLSGYSTGITVGFGDEVFWNVQEWSLD